MTIQKRISGISGKTIGEILRFGIVGILATGIHYLIYYLLKQIISPNAAFTIGYAVSFVFNFILTSLFTFKTQATVKRGAGFGLAHLCNYLLLMGLLNLALALGINSTLAPIPVYGIAIPVNFLMVRFVFKHKKK
ncbi:MAG: GtrA family protein [Coprobacter sp.]|nr:GtrA family protein [Coprobacter sp.]